MTFLHHCHKNESLPPFSQKISKRANPIQRIFRKNIIFEEWGPSQINYILDMKKTMCQAYTHTPAVFSSTRHRSSVVAALNRSPSSIRLSTKLWIFLAWSRKKYLPNSPLFFCLQLDVQDWMHWMTPSFRSNCCCALFSVKRLLSPFFFARQSRLIWFSVRASLKCISTVRSCNAEMNVSHPAIRRA